MKFLVEKYFWLWLGLILSFAFLTRIYQVGQIKTYIFDEVYHAVTAKLIHRGDPRAFEWWNEPPEPSTAVDWLHPPFAKYTQALGMTVFGETPFGWRISSVIFGTLVIAATVLLAEELFHDKRISILAGALASFDGLLLVQSRIAMNDIHVTFFILLSFVFYLKYRAALLQKAPETKAEKEQIPEFTLFHRSQNKRHLFLLFLTSVCLGLAAASKWSGFFAIMTILFFEFISLVQQLKAYVSYYEDQKFLSTRLPEISRMSYISGVFQSARTPSVFLTIFKTIFFQASKVLIYVILIPGIIYVSSYWQMFAQGKTLVCEQDFVQQGSCYCEQTNSWWVEGLKIIMPQNSAKWESLEARGGCKRLISHFSELHTQIWWYQTNLKATHPYQSRPIQWFLDIRPVWMFVAYGQDQIANIYTQGNPILFWLGDIAILLTVVTILTKGVKDVMTAEPVIKQNEVLTHLNYVPALSPLRFITFAYFIVWLPWQLSPRIMFFYHYTPAVPTLAIILSYWLVKSQNISTEVHFAGKTLAVRRLILWLSVLAVGATFFIFYPNWIGIFVPNWYANTFFFALPGWK